MTSPRKIVAVGALSLAGVFATMGIAAANPEHVDDGGHNGGHSNSHKDHYGFGDDNSCDFKYRRDGSRNPNWDGDSDDCPKINRVFNDPNPGVDGSSGTGASGFSLPGL